MLLRYIFLGGDFVWWRRDQIPFTLHEIPVALAPLREPYRIGLLFTHTNGDFGTVSATEMRRVDLESGPSHTG